MTTRKVASRIGNRLFFTMPTTIVFTLTFLVPFAYGLYLTFMKMDTVISVPVYTGLDNYIKAFSDKRFWASMGVTVRYVFACLVMVNVIGFGLAFLVTSGIKGQNFFRTALFTPNLIGGLVLGYIWQFIFVRSLPDLGQRLGIEFLRLGWLGDAQMAFWALVIVTIWQLSGYMMIIYIAGFESLPKDVIEAATIDGMNGWQRLIKIILPLMAPAFVITIFLTLKNCFMVYDFNYSLTAGGPYDSTKLVSMHIVLKAFSEYHYSEGQAEAVILFIIVALISGLQVYFGKKREVEA